MNNNNSTIDTETFRDFFLPDEAHIAELRRIIRTQGGHKFTYDETRDVAYQLIRLYECLAGGTQIYGGDSDEHA